jgi:hypothetical protein
VNTTTRSSRIGPAAAIILGCALAITPITAHAGETDATQRDVGSIRLVPNDADPRGRHVVRGAASADTGLAPFAARGNLGQQLEADAGQTATGILPILRQHVEADRGDAVPDIRPNLRQRIEDGRTPEPVPPPRVVPNDTDPRERQVRAPAPVPDVYVHQRVLGLG